LLWTGTDDNRNEGCWERTFGCAFSSVHRRRKVVELPRAFGFLSSRRPCAQHFRRETLISQRSSRFLLETAEYCKAFLQGKQGFFLCKRGECPYNLRVCKPKGSQRRPHESFGAYQHNICHHGGEAFVHLQLMLLLKFAQWSGKLICWNRNFCRAA